MLGGVYKWLGSSPLDPPLYILVLELFVCGSERVSSGGADRKRPSKASEFQPQERQLSGEVLQ
jgi:hypothetical protein